MTVTITTGLPVETDSVLASGTRGLSGQVYAATAVDPSDSPFVYLDIATALTELFFQFDLRIPRATLDSWRAGGREALLFEFRNMDTDESLLELWVKYHQGRFVWFAATSGDSAYGNHMANPGTHTINAHWTTVGSTVQVGLDTLAVDP